MRGLLSKLSDFCGGAGNTLPATEPSAAAIFNPTPARIECAWCKIVISPGAEPVSHGICPQCFDVAVKDVGPKQAAGTFAKQV